MIEFTINNIPKLSLNKYNNLHWTEKKKFKDILRLLTMASTKLNLESGYNLEFYFTFKGNKLDTINVAHYSKIIEDTIFKQDNKNRKICLNVEKGFENKVKVILKKIGY